MNLTYELVNEISELYERVVDHYGVPTWWDVEPDLICYHDPNDGLYGWHTLEEIGVNIAICECWTDIVGTLLHEYHHHMQDPERWDEEEYEREANHVAFRDLHLFLNPLEA